MKVISDENFEEIQRLAKPFVDTLDSKLAEIIAFYKNHASLNQVARSVVPKKNVPEGQIQVPRLDAFASPDLTHTKLVFASVQNRVLMAPSWNSLLYAVVTRSALAFDFEVLRSITSANVIKGKKTDEGYHYLDTVDLSVQGQSANDAWRAITNLAIAASLRIEATFFWRQKKGALKPGESGSFLIEGAP